ncbi:MAG TPA: HAMP domain-containing sensor histidine kinase [Ramlibacter sp.]|nr:HAMP domain-containing sensor histidine kinase [Ramlibacter sp.]
MIRLASFRRRILFRGVFLLLAIATVALAVVLLKEEKERSWRDYREGFRKTRAEALARLRHPAGLLSLLNPGMGDEPPGTPVMLPYAGLDFDDQNKVQQAVELAGCSVRYPDGSSLCTAVGSNPYTGGFIYLVGSFAATEMVPRDPGSLDLAASHRAVITLAMRGATAQWIAPFELLSDNANGSIRGRLVAFADPGDTPLADDAKPLRDFRGLLWQTGVCADGSEDTAKCAKRAFFSIRLPVEAFREALLSRQRPVWPPADLNQFRVRMRMVAPSGTPVFDSQAPGGEAPASLNDIRKALLPGETLQVKRLGATQPAIVFKGIEDDAQRPSPIITRLVRRLPLEGPGLPAPARDVITTPVGNYEVLLSGNSRGVERSLAAVATRMSWYVGAMLAAIVLAWLVIEVGLIRRITVLTRRAADVSRNVARLDVADLRGEDELGVLAAGLDDLLKREQVRSQQERDMLQAVGHEILSPLQSLMVLHPDAKDPAHRYVQRMQQAVRVLYGQASPSEALASAAIDVATLDLDAFLRQVADNASFAGIEDVRYQSPQAAVPVRAEEFALEDIVTHVLRNAQRHRTPGTPITITLSTGDKTAIVAIHDEGDRIDEALIERIFEYGFSGSTTGTQRGQGLFVVRTYLAKMGGTVRARNVAGGVTFELSLVRA